VRSCVADNAYLYRVLMMKTNSQNYSSKYLLINIFILAVQFTLKLVFSHVVFLKRSSQIRQNLDLESYMETCFSTTIIEVNYLMVLKIHLVKIMN